MENIKQHLPLSPCTPETALQKVQLAENAWNIQGLPYKWPGKKIGY
ncbi:hypothetical protein [Chryseobacterium sp.]|nr:hypothetical protein [Chryseobacterium sp.]